MKTKVVQFVAGFRVGGAENLAKQYCMLLDKSKIDLYVIAIINFHTFNDEDLKQAGIQVIYIDELINEKFRFLPRNLKKVMCKLLRKCVFKKILKKIEPDVVHYHLALSDYVQYAKLRKQTRIILTVHSEPKRIWDGSQSGNRDEKSIRKMIEQYDFKFIVLHNKMAQEIKTLFCTDNVTIMNNGVMVDKFRYVQPNSDLKSQLQIDEHTFVVGHIGRFNQVKNHLFLIDVFREILNINPDSKLVLVGEGQTQIQVKHKVDEMKITDKVHFLGVRTDIPELLALFDIIVFPSFYEGLSITLIESQVASVKCLVSDTVNEETKISNTLEFMSLENSPEVWAEKAVRMVEEDITPVCNFDNWDLRKIVKRLEELYMYGK
jgi:glycosyltransferase involved in cell wall biosynthesis